MQTIGFIGLGTMGGQMAARYLEAGYTVYGEDVEQAAARPLIDRGLRWLDTPRQVADSADVIMTSLPNDSVVESVARGPEGIIAGLAYGKVWADLSTISPQASRALAEQVRRDGHGAKMLDTPVSGSVPQVKSGTLTIMVGGELDAFELIEPVLNVLGTPHHIGDNGQGLVLKLAINISLAVQMIAFAEGLLLATRDGIDPHRAADVMSQSLIGLADAEAARAAAAGQARRGLVRHRADAQGHPARATRGRAASDRDAERIDGRPDPHRRRGDRLRRSRHRTGFTMRSSACRMTATRSGYERSLR